VDSAPAPADQGAAAAAEEATDTRHAPMAASGLSSDELAELTASWGTPNGQNGSQ